MAVTFLNQLLFVQFQRETTQNKKLIRGLPPYWGRDGLTGAPPSCSQQSKLFAPFFLGPKTFSLMKQQFKAISISNDYSCKDLSEMWCLQSSSVWMRYLKFNFPRLPIFFGFKIQFSLSSHFSCFKNLIFLVFLFFLSSKFNFPNFKFIFFWSSYFSRLQN